MEKILAEGDFGVIFDNGKVEKGATDQGLVFKNYKAFEEGKGICYIPELCGDIIEEMYSGDRTEFCDKDYASTFTKKDFLDLVNGNERLAKIIFEMVDWQYPGTLVDELYSEDDEFRKELDDWDGKH